MRLEEEPIDGNSICDRVIEKVAAHKGVDLLELERPLHEAVDPDALENLFAQTTHGTSRSAGRVTFPFADCQVTVEADGIVHVSDHSWSQL